MSIQTDDAHALAQLARRNLPRSLIIKGGVHETFSAQITQRLHHDYVDVSVVEEAEEIVASIVRTWADGEWESARQRIPGLVWLQDGNLHSTGRPMLPNVNRWIPPRTEHHGSYDFPVFNGLKTAQVLTSRGCAHSCFYCSESVLFGRKRARYRCLASLDLEMRQLRAQGYRAIYFDDSTFTADREWAITVGELANHHGFVWGFNTRVDAIDEDLVFRLRNLGATYQFCGVESAVPEVLLAMNKTQNPSDYLESARRAYRALRSAELPCSAFLIFGGPRRVSAVDPVRIAPESPEDREESLRFAIFELDPDYLSMNVLRLLPGLPFSIGKQFACLRPTGYEPIHGGHYDSEWYRIQNVPDLRSTHSIYRGFEGCRSVNPHQMTEEVCYGILKRAVELTNLKNLGSGARQTRIIVDARFKKFLGERIIGRKVQYNLASFFEIENEPPLALGNQEWTESVTTAHAPSRVIIGD